MVDLRSDHLEMVRAVLAALVPDCEVCVFGSRARSTAKPWSDLDVVVRAASTLPLQRLWRLEEAFEDSDLPFRVDVVDWHAMSDAFRSAIEKECVVIWSPAATTRDMGIALAPAE